MFRGDESYKLKYNASQARLFVRLLPFILSSLVDKDDGFYHLLKELISIVQIVFSPVISVYTTGILRVLIAQQLRRFKKEFPNVNIIPKQHYLVHFPNMIRQLGPLIRNRKQNFKNLPKSLAERCQLNECGNFGDPDEKGISHPLFSTERNYGVLKLADKSSKKSFRSQLDNFGCYLVFTWNIYIAPLG